MAAENGFHGKRGATDHELDAHTNELEHLRRRLADLIGGQRS
jgi:hypothetical protein